MIVPARVGRGVRRSDPFLHLLRESVVMRTLSKLFLGVSLVAILAGPALAQGRGGGRGFGGGGLGMLLSNTSVQKELKLDEAQVDKARELAEKAREKLMSATEGLEGQERFAKMREIGKELADEAEKSAKEFLKPEQFTRLHQLQHQAQGVMAFADEKVQAALKLTDDQKTAMQELIETSSGEMRELFANMQSDPEGTRAKIAEHRKETLAKAASKLTDAQKTAWKDLVGSPFEIKWERPGGGRGR
jgi:hypothetical protein